MDFLRRLLAGKNAKSRGNKAIKEAIEGFEEIIQDLNEAISEADEELIEAQIAVGLAVNERDNIQDIKVKGESFLSGLRALLQG